MGGDSLKATVLLSRINKEFEVYIPLVQILHLQTIAQLAAHVKGGQKRKFEPLVPADLQPFYPVSPAQKECMCWINWVEVQRIMYRVNCI